MSKTDFSKENSSFSNNAHRAAQRIIYPSLFNVGMDRLHFIDTTIETGSKGDYLDGTLGIDRIVGVDANLRMPLLFSIQERFRKSKYDRYQSLTITEWNPESNTPSELYKIIAQYFVYGYYGSGKFSSYIVADIAQLMRGIYTGELNYNRGSNPRSKQPYIELSFSALRDYGCLIDYDLNTEKRMI